LPIRGINRSITKKQSPNQTISNIGKIIDLHQEKIMKKITALSILVLLAVMLSACGGSGLPKEVLGTTWEWQQLSETSPASQSMIANSANYTLGFNPDNLYVAKADCNIVQGEYEVSGDSLTLKAGPSTLAECGAESSYFQYVGFLAQVDGYRLENGKLVLTFGNGAGEIIFANVGMAK
jgi:heat shock protein HslJ